MIQARATAPETKQPRRVLRNGPLRFRPRVPGAARWGAVMEDRPLGGRGRALRRLVTVMVWTLLCIPVQALLLLFPGRAKARFPQLYWRGMCWLIGLKLQVVGRPAGHDGTLYVSNHTSWLDILVLGAVLETRFVSKADVASWPGIGVVAKLGRTLFVSRNRAGTGRESNEISATLKGGDSVMLFPEGTTSDGTRVLPFRSSFLSVAAEAKQVQPTTVVYDRMGGLPACRRDRPVFAWYGDMETLSHAWFLLRHTGTRATVVFHEAFAPETLPNRKVMASEIGRIVSISAAQLRQNRPVEALAAPARRG
jgi:1-acyl-sn-glycerol-3-phosphate acyltransferase